MKNQIDKVFNNITKSKYIHEAILLVENTSGSFREELGYKRNADSPIFTASVGKLFVTACILIFKEQGKLKLCDKLSNYFNDKTLEGLHVFKGRDYSFDLTLSDLLFHKSGLTCWYQTGGVFQRIVNEDFEFSFEEQIASTKNRPALFAPDGKKAYYSDMNFGLLGKVLEQIEGKSIDKIYEKYIIKPLKLKKTFLINQEDLAIPIYFGNKKMKRPKFLGSHGEQSIITTADELMTFIKAFFLGMLFDQKVFEELSIYTSMQSSMFPMRSGGGFWQIPLGGLANLFMGEGELLGHSGSTGSFAFYYPQKDLFMTGDFNQAYKPSYPIKVVIKIANLKSD